MLDLNIIYEKQFKRHKKDSSWGSLRPASVSCDDTSSDNNWKGSGDENTLNPHSRSAASGSPLTDARTRSAKSFRCWSTAASCALTANRRKAWRGHSFRPRQEAFGESGTPGGQAQELPERRGFISHGCWLPIELRKKSTTAEVEDDIVDDFEELLSTFAFHTADCTYEGVPPPPANARTFPILNQFLCNNTNNNNQHNNNKQLTVAGRNTTADFSVFPPGGGRFFSRKISPLD